MENTNTTKAQLKNFIITDIDYSVTMESALWTGDETLPKEQGSKNNIYLWNWIEGKKIALTNNGHSSMPSASEHWAVWKDAPRYTASPNYVIYDLETKQMESFHAGKGCSTDPKVTGHWLYSPGCDNGFAAYDLQNKQRVNMVQWPKGQKFRRVLTDERMMWDVVSSKSNQQALSPLQWRTLP